MKRSAKFFKGVAVLLSCVSLHIGAMHTTKAGRIAKTDLHVGFSSRITSPVQRFMNRKSSEQALVRASRTRVLKAACYKQTPHFNVQEYIEAGGDFNEHVLRENGVYTGKDAEFTCRCMAPWPISTASDSAHLRNAVRTFRTHPTVKGESLLHSLPACRTKMLLEHSDSADLAARNMQTVVLGEAPVLRNHEAQLLARIEEASKRNGDQYPQVGIHGTYYFVGNDGIAKLAQGVSRGKYHGEADYLYHRLTPLMSAIYYDDFPKFIMLLTASFGQEFQKDLLDLQIIAGRIRFCNRAQGKERDLLKPSDFENVLTHYENIVAR